MTGNTIKPKQRQSITPFIQRVRCRLDTLIQTPRLSRLNHGFQTGQPRIMDLDALYELAQRLRVFYGPEYFLPSGKKHDETRTAFIRLTAVNLPGVKKYSQDHDFFQNKDPDRYPDILNEHIHDHQFLISNLQLMLHEDYDLVTQIIPSKEFHIDIECEAPLRMLSISELYFISNYLAKQRAQIGKALNFYTNVVPLAISYGINTECKIYDNSRSQFKTISLLTLGEVNHLFIAARKTRKEVTSTLKKIERKRYEINSLILSKTLSLPNNMVKSRLGIHRRIS